MGSKLYNSERTRLGHLEELARDISAGGLLLLHEDIDRFVQMIESERDNPDRWRYVMAQTLAYYYLRTLRTALSHEITKRSL